MAVGGVRHRGGLPDRRTPRDRRRHERSRGQGGRADRHRRHEGRRQGRRRRRLHLHRRRRRDPRGQAAVAATSCRPATRWCCRARSASTGWRSCWPAATWPSTPTSPPTPRRCTNSSRHCLQAAPSTRWMRDATRGGVGTVANELVKDSAVRADPRRGKPAGACRRCSAPATCSASTRCTSRTRASSSPIVAGRRGRRGDRRAARTSAGRRCRGRRRDRPRAARHRRAANFVRRQPDRRHARRRPAAADLLRLRRFDDVSGNTRPGGRHRRRRTVPGQGRRQRRAQKHQRAPAGRRQPAGR